MRKLSDHKVNECNETLEISVLDEPGSGGASHAYEIRHTEADPSKSFVYWINFQKGPIKESGVNGITQEALLAICADRLRCFQAGLFASRENAVALTHIETAQMWLQKRTRDRLARGVEGTHTI